MNKRSSKKITVGIAGYMGSGKSTFSAFLADCTGFRLVNGDLVAKDLMNALPVVQHALARAFGRNVVNEKGVDAAVLGAIVFSDLEKLKQLNAIVHPVLLDSLRNMIFNESADAVIIDAALLPLWDIRAWFDTAVWIDAEGERRCERICRNGGVADVTAVRKRIALQEQLFAAPPSDEWMYIDNKGELSDLQDSAARLAEILLHLQGTH